MKDEKILNRMNITIPALSVNEGVCRSVVGVFCAQLNPTIEELADIKCAVSEAVTNCIVHAYKNEGGEIYISTVLYNDRSVKIEIRDKGCGIADVQEARQPLFTTDAASERSGMGFTVMESFTDKILVKSRPDKGTSIVMYKKFGDRRE